MKKIVNRYPVPPDATVTFTAKADDNVSAYGAKLFFKDKDGTVTEKEAWTSGRLKDGSAKFTFDATGKERYQIDLAAQISAPATIATKMTFSIHPPEDDPDSLPLDPSEPGDIVRFWQFAPKKVSA